MLPKFIQPLVDRNPVLLPAALLFLFSLLIYAGSLNNGFVWDDEGVFTNAPEIREPANIPSFFIKPLIPGESDAPNNYGDIRIHYYRPLLQVLHVFEYRLFGPKPFGYKLVNLLFNGIVVVCAFRLILAITGERSLAFFSALLYAANPARGEVVYWAYSDSHILAALFSLLTLLAYHHRRTCLALGTMALGLFFQEGTFLVTLILPAYQLTIAPKNDKEGWLRIVPFLVLAVVYFVLRQLVAGSLPLAELSFTERVRSIAYLLAKHVQICFLPDAPVTMYRYAPGMFANNGVTTPAVVFCALLILSCGVWLLWRQRRWFFWYAWFVTWIALVFNVGSYTDYLMTEKPMYLASLGPCVLLTKLLTRETNYRTAGLAVLLALFGYHTWNTVNRGQYWTDTTTYIEKLLEFEPNYDVAQYMLGVEYQRKGHYAEAIRQFDNVIELLPNTYQRFNKVKTDTYEKWGQALADKGDIDGALIALNKARQLSPQRSSIHNGLGIIHFLRGEKSQATTSWETAIRLDPSNIEARTNLEKMGGKSAAVK